jgi:hypothetical protein
MLRGSQRKREEFQQHLASGRKYCFEKGPAENPTPHGEWPAGPRFDATLGIELMYPPSIVLISVSDQMSSIARL